MEIIINNLKRIISFEKENGDCKVEVKDMKLDDYKLIAREIRERIEKMKFVCDIKIQS